MVRGILLAAGSSRRMGRDKLALPWADGTVLSATLARWTAVQDLQEVLLVRRRADERSWPRVCCVLNPDADEGMGSSLRVGARALPADTEAVVVGLADMPEVAPETLAALIAAWRPLGPRGIVAPLFDGRRGHPVVLGSHHLAALRSVQGDEGARTILKENAGDVVLVPVDDPGVLLDLDSPADLERRP